MIIDRNSQSPPRFIGRARSQSAITSLSPITHGTIPSPLASPVTATANSLTALSISQTSAHSVLTGRDLSKITVPRERKKSRPYSVSSAESLLAQEHKKSNNNNNSNKEEDRNQDHSSGPSDTENSKRNGYGASKSTGKESKTEMKSPSLKPATQLRVTLYNLVSTGYLPAGTLVVFREYSAIVTAKGTLIPQIKETDPAASFPSLQSEYETPSAWATAMVKGCRTGKVAVNGWSAIKISIQQLPEISKIFGDQGLTEVSLDVLRKRYLADLNEEGSTQTENCTTQTNVPKGNEIIFMLSLFLFFCFFVFLIGSLTQYYFIY
jgi:hypothetical protein